MDSTHPVTYTTLATQGEGVYKERGSKFFGFAFPITSAEDVKVHLEALRAAHHNARHFCYAFRVNPKNIYERANDDGEPRHSAGTPILGQLLAHDLVDVLVVVVRYFGGTKLGVPGLITAYKSAAALALNQAVLVTRTFKARVQLVFDYTEMNAVHLVLKRHNAEIIKQQMLEQVTLSVEVNEDSMQHVEGDFANFKTIKFGPYENKDSNTFPFCILGLFKRPKSEHHARIRQCV